MEMTKEIKEMPNFSSADHTIIASDLHLTEEQKPLPNNPLWKKYKTREFFFDKEFAHFLDLAEKRAIEKSKDGKPVIELILNGDIFDFDSVTAVPEEPTYKISWIEKRRGLFSEEEKAVFKIGVIIHDHAEWFEGLHSFLMKGHRIIFVTGNHDVEILFPSVQEKIRAYLNLPKELEDNLRFVQWFYISNQDTLIEHGNQYDPYCVTANPIHPMIQTYNKIEMRIPFGNLATRYMINGMGFFNPYADTNFIMSIKDYIKLFIKYMVRKQPLLIFTWFWSSSAVLIHSLMNRFYPEYKDPLRVEDQVEEIAKKSNATPRMVREMKELAVEPATSSPILIAQELWLDRAFLFLITLVLLFQFFSFVKLVYDISFFWMFIPILLFTPFIIFYSSSVISQVMEFKEPRERVMNQSSQITKVRRVVYGHTHVLRHEIIGVVEHLNSGTWSPAFLDIECTKLFSKKTCVWIEPGESEDDGRVANIWEYRDGNVHAVQNLRHSAEHKDVH